MGRAMPGRAFEDLRADAEWAETLQRLRRVAGALTRSSDEADDLTQQTLLNLLTKAPERASHIGLARTTMVRLWLDRQRSVRRRMARMARLALMTNPWTLERDAFAAGDTRDRLHHAIELLPPQQRAVLVMRIVEELDYAAIAETLNCSLEAVRANLHLARRRVRKSMGEKP